MARGNSLGNATIGLELEYSKVSKGIDEVNKKLGGFQKGLKRMSGALKGVFAVGSIYAFSRALNTTLSELDKIGKTAAKIGVTTDALQELRFAAEQSGVGVQALDMGLQRFVRRTAEAAKGTGVLFKEFESLGIGLKNADGSMRSVEAVLADYADAIANAKDEQEQLRLAFAAFDSEGAALVNLFRSGSIGVEQLRQELRDLGGVIDADLIAKSESANDAMNRVSKAIGGAMTTALANLAPIIENVANWIVELTKKWRNFLASIVPAANLGMRQLEEQIKQTGANIMKLQDELDAAIGKQNAGGLWDRHIGRNEQINVEKELRQQRERLVELQQALKAAEKNGNDLASALDGVGTSAGSAGTAVDKASEKLQFFGKFAAGFIEEAQDKWSAFYRQMDGKYRMSMDEMLDLWNRLGEAVTGAGEKSKESIEETTRVLFDMKEAILDVQRNIQQGFSDLFYDVFSGKGVDSFKDFAKRVLDIFKRLLADMAAAAVASKVFKWFNIDTGGFSFKIGGGGSSGGSVSDQVINAGIKKGIAKVGETAAGQAVKTWWTKNITGSYFNSGNVGFKGPGVANYGGAVGGGGAAAAGGYTSAAPGALGSVKGPAVMNYSGGSAAGGGMGAWAGAAVIAAAAIGASYIASRDAKEAAKFRGRYAENFGGMTPQELGESGSFLGAFENGAGKVDEMYVAVNERLNKALQEAGLITRSLNLQFTEAGDPVRRMVGDVDAVKMALEGAKITGFEFAGSIETAIEKGNGLEVSIDGNADAIREALESAAAAGVGGFQILESQGGTTTARLTGDIAQWNKVLQEFVNSAVMAAVSGVDSLGGAAASATSQFQKLAAAASSVRVGSTVLGGRAGQVNGIPQMADGGVVHSRTIAEIGERGPEAVIPLKNGAVPVTGVDNSAVVMAIKQQTRAMTRIERRRQYGLATAR